MHKRVQMLMLLNHSILVREKSSRPCHVLNKKDSHKPLSHDRMTQHIKAFSELPQSPQWLIDVFFILTMQKVGGHRRCWRITQELSLKSSASGNDCWLLFLPRLIWHEIVDIQHHSKTQINHLSWEVARAKALFFASAAS